MSEGQFLKIWDYIDEAKEAGYTFLCGGDRESASRKSRNICRKEMKETLGEKNEGYFITPCILSMTHPDTEHRSKDFLSPYSTRGRHIN